jgi:hypothetical protein
MKQTGRRERTGLRRAMRSRRGPARIVDRVKTSMTAAHSPGITDQMR